jgi:hypothetical protein
MNGSRLSFGIAQAQLETPSDVHQFSSELLRILEEIPRPEFTGGGRVAPKTYDELKTILETEGFEEIVRKLSLLFSCDYRPSFNSLSIFLDLNELLNQYSEQLCNFDTAVWLSTNIQTLINRKGEK